MKLFEVEAKCGHVGKNKFTLKIFAVKAESAKRAAEIVRQIPRVKHHHKDAIRRVVEISFNRYIEICNINKEDPYFTCKNIQEHRQKVTDCVVFQEMEYEVKEKEKSKKLIYIGKELIRKPKRFIKNYTNFEMRYVA